MRSLRLPNIDYRYILFPVVSEADIQLVDLDANPEG